MAQQGSHGQQGQSRNMGYSTLEEDSAGYNSVVCDSGINLSFVADSYRSGMCLEELQESSSTSLELQMNALRVVDDTISSTTTIECPSEMTPISEVTTPTNITEGSEVHPEKLYKLFEQDEDGDTQLHMAVIKQDLLAASYMIAIAPTTEHLNIQNSKYHQTPLHLAVIENAPQIVRMLVVWGASLTSRDRHGDTALHLAAARGFIDCARQITTPPTEQELTQLIQNRSMLGIRQQIQHCYQMPDMKMLNYEGYTCLHVACLSSSPNRFDIVRHLVNNCSADINMQEGRCGATVLHQAVKSKDSEMVALLLHCPTLAINKCLYNGCTALGLARNLPASDLVQLLEQHGAQVSCQDIINETSSDSTSEDDDETMDDFDDLTIGGQQLSIQNCGV